MEIKEWIRSFDVASIRHFAPGAIYDGVQGALRWARELGYGLAPYTDQEIRAEIGGLYSLLVRHTLGKASGVPVDAKDVVNEVYWAVEHARMPLGTMAEREASLAHHRRHLSQGGAT